MGYPLPAAFRQAMANNAKAPPTNPMGISESESASKEGKKGEKPNPLKNWADSKLSGR